MFKVARSETGNGLDACTNCVLLPTKPGIEQVKKPGKFDNLMARIYRFRQIRKSTGKINLSKIKPIEYEGLLALDFAIERYERASAGITRQLLEDNLEMMRQICAAMGGMR